jgi:hypothetical protein
MQMFWMRIALSGKLPLMHAMVALMKQCVLAYNNAANKHVCVRVMQGTVYRMPLTASQEQR